MQRPAVNYTQTREFWLWERVENRPLRCQWRKQILRWHQLYIRHRSVIIHTIAFVVIPWMILEELTWQDGESREDRPLHQLTNKLISISKVHTFHKYENVDAIRDIININFDKC